MEKFSPTAQVGKSLLTVHLGCGDQVTARNPPLNNRSTYICPAGKGHGYSIPWVRYTTRSGFTKNNPTQEGETT